LAALVESGLPPHRLEVEVTETVLVDDAEAALACLRRIRALGVRIALDDFGTGYSSLSYLRMFPFDKIKIDRSFIKELMSTNQSRVIVKAIHDIALGLDMSVTAEGVETTEQAEELRRSGCDELQGFLYSKPCTASLINSVLRRRFAA
jgi:EAL domain-containing protein (putative c-di-GMP-specific phosphodiesterase class I)